MYKIKLAFLLMAGALLLSSCTGGDVSDSDEASSKVESSVSESTSSEKTEENESSEIFISAPADNELDGNVSLPFVPFD